MKTKKKITLLSIIVIVVGSVIGAGIFFKNKTLFSLAQGNFAWVIGAWSFAIFGIFALALAIIEISSRSETNTGILEWAKKFTPSFMYNSSKNFMVVFFLPITVVSLPFFAIDMFEQAGLKLENYEVIIIWLAMLVYFLVTNWISLRFSEISQWFFTAIQMIPLFIVPLLAVLNILPAEDIANKAIGTQNGPPEIHGLAAIAPGLVLVSGIPAIMFAFDGFYEGSSLRKNMVDPSKNTKAIIISIALISAIYIWVTIGFGLGTTNGAISGLNLKSWVRKLLEILISIGVISTINGYVMASLNQFEDLDSRAESMVLVKFKKLFEKIGFKNKSDRFYGFGFLATITLPSAILLWAIGSYVWHTGQTYSSETIKQFSGVNALIDVMTNYNSLFIFLIITLSIIGGLINRKTKRLDVDKSRFFIPAAIISSIFVFTAIIWSFTETFVNLSGYNGADVLNNAIKLSLICSFLIISMILGFIEMKWLPKHKHNIGHEKEEWEFELIKSNKLHKESKKTT